MSRTALHHPIPLIPTGAELRADERMARLALAFELELAQADADEGKWPLRYGIGMSIVCSALLWAVIAVAAFAWL